MSPNIQMVVIVLLLILLLGGTALLRKVLGILKSAIGVVLGLILIYFLMQYLPFSKQFIPDDLQALSGTSVEMTRCMVEKSWNSLTPESQTLITQGNLFSLSATELQKIYQHSAECSK